MPIEHYIAGYNFPINSNHLLNSGFESDSYWASSMIFGTWSYISSGFFYGSRSLQFSIGAIPEPPIFGEITLSSSQWFTYKNDCTATGQYVCTNFNTDLYVSKDYGISWINAKPENNDFYLIAFDATGGTLMVGGYNGRLWTSNNVGSSWTERRPAGRNEGYLWISGAISADGSKLLACSGQTLSPYGRVFLSTNSGVNWSDITPNSANRYWRGCMNYDGSMICVGHTEGRLYVTRDYGSSWFETRPNGNLNWDWESIECNRTGNAILACISSPNSGRIYKSLDYGSSWFELKPAGNANKHWYALSCNSSGNTIFAGIYQNVCYCSYDSGSSWAQISSSYNSWVDINQSQVGSPVIYASAGFPIYKFYGGLFS